MCDNIRFGRIALRSARAPGGKDGGGKAVRCDILGKRPLSEILAVADTARELNWQGMGWG